MTSPKARVQAAGIGTDGGRVAGEGPGARVHAHSGSQHLQLVRQEMAVCPEQLSEFVDSLRQYLRSTAQERNCFQ